MFSICMNTHKHTLTCTPTSSHSLTHPLPPYTHSHTQMHTHPIPPHIHSHTCTPSPNTHSYTTIISHQTHTLSNVHPSHPTTHTCIPTASHHMHKHIHVHPYFFSNTEAEGFCIQKKKQNFSEIHNNVHNEQKIISKDFEALQAT